MLPYHAWEPQDRQAGLGSTWKAGEWLKDRAHTQNASGFCLTVLIFADDRVKRNGHWPEGFRLDTKNFSAGKDI